MPLEEYLQRHGAMDSKVSSVDKTNEEKSKFSGVVEGTFTRGKKTEN